MTRNTAARPGLPLAAIQPRRQRHHLPAAHPQSHSPHSPSHTTPVATHIGEAVGSQAEQPQVTEVRQAQGELLQSKGEPRDGAVGFGSGVRQALGSQAAGALEACEFGGLSCTCHTLDDDPVCGV